MRHGRPRLAPDGWISAAAMGDWIAAYDRAEVVDDGVPEACRRLAAAAGCIASSNAPRALSSLRLLERSPALADDLFREAELPYAAWPAPQLPPQAWAALFRLLWLGGYSRGCEPCREARERARRAAGHLRALADAGPVLLLGHGIMNRLIGRELQAAGWRRQGAPGRGYWSFATYTAFAWDGPI